MNGLQHHNPVHADSGKQQPNGHLPNQGLPDVLIRFLEANPSLNTFGTNGWIILESFVSEMLSKLVRISSRQPQTNYAGNPHTDHLS